MTVLEPVPVGDVRLSVAIQHHPSRPDLPGRLLSMLELGTARYGEVEVVSDPEPFGPVSPWRTARKVWLETPDWCTHRLLLQDDILPVPGFLTAAVEAIRHRPNDVVSFFLGWFPTWAVQAHREAAERGESWSPIEPHAWVPCLALSIPKEIAHDLGNYEIRPYRDDDSIADDQHVGAWCRDRAITPWQTVPSLVQHDDDEVSTLAGHRQGMRRIANCFIGHHDPSTIDWSRG